MPINLFRRSRADGLFQTRAPTRDQELDDQLVGQVAAAIDEALQKVEAQRDGLKRRLDDVKTVHENESVYIPIGAVHRLENPGKILLELIEVQTGSYLGEDDIIRIEDDYRRS